MYQDSDVIETIPEECPPSSFGEITLESLGSDSKSEIIKFKGTAEAIDPNNPNKYKYQYVLPKEQRLSRVSKTIKQLNSEIPLEIAQEAEILNGEYFMRRTFSVGLGDVKQESGDIGTLKSSPKQTGLSEGDQIARKKVRSTRVRSLEHDISEEESQDESTSNEESKYEFCQMDQSNCLGCKQPMVIAKNKKTGSVVVIRIRTGQSGYSEWMNELQVYLLPKFKHKNVLDFYGSDTRYKGRNSKGPKISDLLHKNQSFDEQAEEFEKLNRRANQIKIEYWLMNKFDNCSTLRDYLKINTLTWPQMVRVARGIINGLHYLHENKEYQDFNTKLAVDGFIRSTNGAIKKVAFMDLRNVIHMKPHLTLSVIHRNLSSLNIVLKGDLTPCIWNFGLSYIHHPFQPTNQMQLIDSELRDIHLASQYSPPEVLKQRGHLTLAAMKSIDMYSCGMIFWELISRTVLPELSSANEIESKERNVPEKYYEPFEREFGMVPSVTMLEYVVCRLRARPRIRNGWLVGKKTNKFVQTVQDLWDHDFDARLHTSTVQDRLSRLCLRNRDKRYKYSYRTSKVFDLPTMWPPEFQCTQVPPFSAKCGPNLMYEDVTCSLAPLKEALISSSSSDYADNEGEGEENDLVAHTSHDSTSVISSIFSSPRSGRSLEPKTSSPKFILLKKRSSSRVRRKPPFKQL